MMWSGKVFDWAAKAFTAFICAVMFINIASLIVIEKISLFSIDSPIIFAFLIAIAMLICFIINLYKDLKANKAYGKSPEGSSNEMHDEIKMVLLYIAGVYLYSLLVRHLHFMFGSITFLSIGMLLLNSDKAKVGIKLGKAVIASVCTVPLLYYVFHGVFNVMLP